MRKICFRGSKKTNSENCYVLFKTEKAKKTLVCFLVVLILSTGFYFQILPGITATESVNYAGTTYYTIENAISPNSTVINLFDYWTSNSDSDRFNNDTGNGVSSNGINSGHQLRFLRGNTGGGINNWTGGSSPRTGLVKNTLVNDYPVLSNSYGGESLSYLFDPDIEHNGKKSFTNVKNLFYLNSDNYYYYNSDENYAYFDETSNNFKVYDKPVLNSFFPFNSIDVDTAYSGTLSSRIHHYFGVTVTSRFIHRYGGFTDGEHNTPTTFEFSGDDDVWIFIDNVLVGDIGGIHSKSSIKIDFSTGNVYINNSSTPSTTIRQQFINAYGVGSDEFNSVEWSDDNNQIFADNTTHVLKFYYLERGNNESNMFLKFNLTEIPESSIYKIDQYGNKLQGAEFALYSAYKDGDGNYYYIADNGNNYVLPNDYNVSTNGVITFSDGGGNVTITPKYVDSTDGNGSMVFSDKFDTPLSMFEIKELLGENFILREIKVPDGYRSVALSANFQIIDGVMVCDDTFSSGVWASNNALVTATNVLYDANSDDEFNYFVPSYDGSGTGTVTGTLFAVVLKRRGLDSNGNFTNPGISASELTNQWYPVYGNDDSGYDIMSEAGIGAAIEAAKLNKSMGNDNVFKMTSTGMQVLIENLPARIYRYYTYMHRNNPVVSEDDPQYIVAYYYTTANSLEGATAANTRRVNSHANITGAPENFDGFDILWGTTIQVTNFENRVYFQKTNINDDLVNDATFALYRVLEDENDNMYYVGDGNERIYLIDNDGYNQGVAVVNNTRGTYKINSNTGVINVIVGGNSYTISPAKNADGRSMIESTVTENEYGEDPGSGMFSKVKIGYYVMREIKPPTGYILNTEEVKILVNDDDIYANAGTRDDGIIIGNGLGYALSNLNQFATEDKIDETLTWLYFVLNYFDKDMSFNELDSIDYNSIHTYLKSVGYKVNMLSGDGTTVVEKIVATGEYTDDLAEAMVTYMIFDNPSDSSRFDYRPDDCATGQDARVSTGKGNTTEAGQGTERLFADVGWTSMSVFQSYLHGIEKTRKYTYYEDLSDYGNIGNLFSRSTVVIVNDTAITNLTVKKVVSGNDGIVLEGAKFSLYKIVDGNKLYYSYDNDNKSLAWIEKTTDNDSQINLQTASDGLIIYKDLLDGTYYLEEVEAPEGYMKLDNEIEVTVAAGSLQIDASSLSKKVTVNGITLTVPNGTGFILPETGGSYNSLYVIAGIGMMVVVISYLIFLRRRYEDEKIM